MPTGPEHYREAEALLVRADGINDDGLADLTLSAAQVHAMLALAAAIRWFDVAGQERPAP